MNRDRGTIKWTSLMLPEHIKELRTWKREDQQTKKPQLDNYELELVSDEIMRAYTSVSSIKLTYWREGLLQDDYGKIVTIDMNSRSLILEDPFTTNRYTFDEITAVQVLD